MKIKKEKRKRKNGVMSDYITVMSVMLDCQNESCDHCHCELSFYSHMTLHLTDENRHLLFYRYIYLRIDSNVININELPENSWRLLFPS